MKKLILASAMSVAMIAGTANAAETIEFGEAYTQCGLGAIIAKSVKKSDTADLLAIVTNVTWDLGTTAVISGMSSPDTCARREVKTAEFIIKAYPQLEKDLAMGQGNYLEALSKISGVKDMSSVRSDFAKLAAQPSYQNMSRQAKAEALYKIVMSKA